MNNQPGLFDFEPEQPYQRHSATSRAAAEGIQHRINELQRRVLAWLCERGEQGGTDEEGIDALGLSSSTYRPRRVELVEKGLARDSGRVRRVRSGKNATVWVAVR